MDNYPRQHFSNSVAEKYSKAMILGEVFPPIKIALIKKKYFLVDGFHRLRARELNKEEDIQVFIDNNINDLEQLFVQAVKENIKHGRVLEEYDKNKIIDRLRVLNFKETEISKIILKPINELKPIKFDNFKRPGRRSSKRFLGFDNNSKSIYRDYDKEVKEQVLHTYIIKKIGEEHLIRNITIIKSCEGIEKISHILNEDYQVGLL